jgi:phosphoribosylformylglycinamidine synthase
MAQIVHALEGMSEACIALDFPIVSGNVSLYNESKATGGGSAILPTPAIGGVGLMEDWTKAASIGFKSAGDEIWLLGKGTGHLGQSLWLREILGREAGPPPPVDLAAERSIGELIRSLIAEGLVSAVHDVSDGGWLVAVAEMALAGSLGAVLENDHALDPRFLFGEDQGCYVVTVPESRGEAFITRVNNGDFDPGFLGRVRGDALVMPTDTLQPSVNLPLADLRAAHEGFFPKLMDASRKPS